MLHEVKFDVALQYNWSQFHMEIKTEELVYMTVYIQRYR